MEALSKIVEAENSREFDEQIYDDEEMFDDYYIDERRPREPSDYDPDERRAREPTTTTTEKQEMTSPTTKRYSPSNSLDDLQKDIESNIGLTTLFNLDPPMSSSMPPSFGPQLPSLTPPTADPATTKEGEEEKENGYSDSEVFSKQRYGTQPSCSFYYRTNKVKLIEDTFIIHQYSSDKITSIVCVVC